MPKVRGKFLCGIPKKPIRKQFGVGVRRKGLDLWWAFSAAQGRLQLRAEFEYSKVPILIF